MPRFCIHCVSKRGKNFGWGEGKEQAEKVIQAMRLFSTGDVGAFIRVDALNAGMSRISLTPALMTDRKGDIYRIAINLRDEFIKFCTEYFARQPKGTIARHLDRFMKAYTNTNWQDRLVDFVTSMEGLVLPNESQELSKQFALRIAWLLGTTRSEREMIFDKARRIYNERSKVVHGQRDVASAKQLNVCGEAEEMNRQLLVRALRKPDQFTEESLKKVLLGV